jgi:hypothetical protein
MLDKFLDSLDPAFLMERSEDEIMRMFLEELPEGSSGGGGGMNIFRSRSGTGGSFQSKGEDGEAAEVDIEAMMNLLRNMMNLRLSKRKIGKELKNREDFLLNKFIYQLTPDEIREMRELVNRFGQKLKSRISLRKKSETWRH